MTTTPDTTTPEVTTPDVSDRLPGGTPQHEQPVDENAASKELDEYVQKIKDSLPSFPLKLRADNNDDKAESKDNTTDHKEPRSTDNDTENKDSVGYVEKIKESLPSFPLMSNADNNVAENSSENKDSRTYVEKFKDSLPSFMSNTDNNDDKAESKDNTENGADHESSPSVPLKFSAYSNEEIKGNDADHKEPRSTDNDTENKDSVGYVEKIKESLPSFPLMSNADNNVAENRESKNIENSSEDKDSGTYVEKIKESLPSIPIMSNADNNVAENRESKNIENSSEDKDSGTYVEKIKESLPSFPLMSNADNNVAENSSENKDSRTYVEKFKDSLPSFSLMSNAENNVAEDNESENNAENKESGNNAENKESRNNAENNIENAENNAENAKKIRDDKIRENFPLRYEPNPSLKATDDNNLANVTSQGSSALGGVGVNPAAIFGLRSESPRHPYYRDHPPEAEHAHSTADQHEIPFDLTGDYNKQKEQEQMAGHKAKSAQEQDKQKSEGKKRAAKPERLDLGVKPLGDQQPPPLPYKPEEDRDRVKQPPGKVHSDGDIGDIPKITKKDRVNATVGKAVGTLKQKIGKIVRSDSLTTKGTEEKAEAQKTKEFAELQKQAKEF